MEKFYDLIIVDTGIDCKNKYFENLQYDGISFHIDEFANLTVGDNIQDNIGHGTSVYYLISKKVNNIKTLIIKAFDNEYGIEAQNLIETLKYIYKNINCKVINLSCGITECFELDELRTVCDLIIDKGIIIVAAFDNLGAISYPSAFENIIGVDWSIECRSTQEYEYIEGSPINIRAIGTEQRVLWINNEYKMVSGSSFATPHITSLILQYLENNQSNVEEILTYLKLKAKTIYEKKSFKTENSFKIGKAIIFPFNKEIHSLMAYRELLNFKIAGIYDTKMLGKVNKNVKDIIKYADAPNLKIENFEEIVWKNDFDTVILGHTRELSNLIGYNFIHYIVTKCIDYNKNIYSFDDLSSDGNLYKKICNSNINVFFPKIDNNNLPTNRFCKLNHIGKPILAVMGTSPKQGKFTLQLELRKRFLKLGYKIGQLGTEPSSLLYGFNEVYPMGYDSSVKLKAYDSIHMINYQLAKIERDNPDIIIVGSQSHSLHLNNGNLNFYPLFNYDLLIASNPDCIILCINYGDSLDYINRTINFIRNFQQSKVIGLVIYPLQKNMKWSIYGNNQIDVGEDELSRFRKRLEYKLKIPSYILNKDDDISMLVEDIVEFFS